MAPPVASGDPGGCIARRRIVLVLDILGRSDNVARRRLGVAQQGSGLFRAVLWPDSDERARDAGEAAFVRCWAPCAERAAARLSLAGGNRTGMRFFYDCEFIEDGRTVDLVSIGGGGGGGRSRVLCRLHRVRRHAGGFVGADARAPEAAVAGRPGVALQGLPAAGPASVPHLRSR